MSPLRRTALAATGSLALVASLGACDGGAADAPAPSGPSDAGGEGQTLTVLAAASLTDVYAQINAEFEKAHPGVRVTMTNGGSHDLVAQISQGAAADVLATADERNMDRASEQGLIAGAPETFATNELTIAVQPGNPHGIDALDDLARGDLAVVECAPEVPCGSVSEQVLRSADVTLAPVSQEGSVTDVLGKVTSGNADAGLVYVTDVRRSRGGAQAVAIPEAAQHRTSYPIAVIEDSDHASLAREYVSFMLGESAQAELRDAGFGAP